MKEPRYVVVEKSCCGTCVHYRQHYILQEDPWVIPDSLCGRAHTQVRPYTLPERFYI